jgi:5-methylcytosine-specific restriction endonuclease McrA
MMARKSISTKTKVMLFNKRGGRCYLCEGKINIGESWDLEHVIPLAMGGLDEESNWELAHSKCHLIKTKADFGNIAKAKRRESRHIGAKESKTPLPFGKKSKWRKKMDGTIVPR